MNTLHFFSEYYYPDTNSTSFFITKTIHACAEEWKHNIRIYCAARKPEKEFLTGSNVHIKRFSVGSMNKNGLASRLIKFIILTSEFFFSALIHVKKGDRVFTVTDPAFVLVLLAFLRKLIHFQYILLVHDIFPEVLIPSGLSKPADLKYRLTLKVFNWAYNNADRIIVIGRDMEDVVKKKVKDSSKIRYIPIWADTKNIVDIPKEDNTILKRLGLENSFVFSIAGNMGRTQGLENVLDALAISKLNQDVAFIFMGDGAKIKKIREVIAEKKLERVFVTGRIPDEEQNAMVSACDIAVISLSKGMYGLCVPSKSFYNMAASKPLLLIADENSEIARVISESKIGWVAPPNNPRALANILNTIQNTSLEELALLGNNARKEAERHYTEDKILPLYVACICGEN